MANCDLVNQVMMNNFADRIDEAIKHVGGDTSSVTDMNQYPGVIRDQLIAGKGSADMTLMEGPGINITKNGTQYTFAADSSAMLSEKLTYGQTEIGTDKSIQQALDIILKTILPTVPSVLAGDVVVIGANGVDAYQHPNGDPDLIKLKKGLKPNTTYMRIFVSSQQEPIYIDLTTIIEQSKGLTDAPKDGGVYGRKDGVWEAISPSGVTTGTLSPTYPKDIDLPIGTPVQKVFEHLFDIVLPALPSVIRGDVITADKNGGDHYQHPKYVGENTKASGLVPNGKYLRLFINSQEEPIYIYCAPLMEKTVFTGLTTPSIKVNVNKDTNEISADLIGGITATMLVDGDKVLPEEVNIIFDEIFK